MKTYSKARSSGLTPDQIGPALRLLRESRERQQSAFAIDVDVTKAMLSSWERSRSLPSLPSLITVLNGLDADFRDLQMALEALEALRKPDRRQVTAGREMRVRQIVEAILDILGGEKVGEGGEQLSEPDDSAV